MGILCENNQQSQTHTATWHVHSWYNTLGIKLFDHNWHFVVSQHRAMHLKPTKTTCQIADKTTPDFSKLEKQKTLPCHTKNEEYALKKDSVS